jgi:glycosyltransferase involved in cell wall biosynthesis
MKPRILFIFSQNDIGGHTKVVLNLGRELENLGYEVNVYVSRITHFYYIRRWRNLKLTSFSFFKYIMFQIYQEMFVRKLKWRGELLGIYHLKVLRYFLKPRKKILTKFDIIVTSGHWQIAEMRSIGFLREANVFNIIHHPPFLNKQDYGDDFLNSKHFNISASEATNDKCNNVGLKIEKMIFTGGVDRSIYYRRNYGTEGNIGFFYYNHPRKNPKLIEGTIQVLQNLVPSLNIVVFGNSYPRTGASENLTLIENLSESRYSEELAKLSLFVYISSLEGFGLPPLEAMACGVPVLTSKVGAVEIYARGVASFLSGNETSLDIANKIIDLIGHPKTLLKMSKAGEIASESWSWERCAQQYRQLFEKKLEISS